MDFKNEIRPIIENIVRRVGRINKAACKIALELKFKEMEVHGHKDKAKIWQDEVDRQLKTGKYGVKPNIEQIDLFQ